MKLKVFITKYFAIFLSILFISCIKDTDDRFHITGNRNVTVGFIAGGGVDSRTTINSDGISTSWSKDDKIALWANHSNGSAALSEKQFQVYYRDVAPNKAMFTTTLDDAMEVDTYTYYATYPTPNSVSGTQANFTVPATQDGRISSGAAIMVATPAKGPQLGIVTGAAEDDDAYEIDDHHLSLNMNHVLHALRFYVPSTNWGFAEGEKIERIVFTMPQTVAGDIALDYTNPYSTITATNGSNTITLQLAKTIGASASAAEIDFAAASIIPTAAFAEGDEIEVQTFTNSHASRSYISLANRDEMQAGHITPISVNCSDVVNRHTIRFIWGGNNLGEDVHTITFKTTAGNEIYKITDVDDFMSKGRHDIDFTFEDKTYLATVAGQQVVVEYESEHAIVSNTITMPSDVATTAKCHEITITVPYLFFEDFSDATTFNHKGNLSATGHDASTISGDSYGLTGWTGNQIAVIASGNGKGLAIRHQNECSSFLGKWQGTYRGRADSAPMSNLKSGASVKVKISFVFSGYVNGAVAPQLTYGYTTAQSAFSGYWASGSSAIDGGTKLADSGTVVEEGISGPMNGSIADVVANSTTGNAISKTFNITGCTNQHRISWDCYAPYDSKNTAAFGKNTQQWIFIGDIKVQIVQ